MMESKSAKSQTFYRNPELPNIELRYGRDTTACYALHTHAEYSLGTVLQGRSDYQYQKQQLILNEGNCVFIPADIAHSCNPIGITDTQPTFKEHSWHYLMLYIKAEYWQQLCKAWQISPDMNQVIGHPIHNNSLHQSLVQLHTIWQTYPNDAHLIKVAWLACFAQLVEHCKRDSSASDNLNSNSITSESIISNSLTWINNNSLELFSLSKLVQETGYKRHQILRKFKQSLGISPYQYALNKRIEQSKELLKSGFSLSATAYQTGFSDQAHFQRTFKKYTAVTPWQYQNSK